MIPSLSRIRRVIDGVDTTLDALEKVPVNEKMRPTQQIRLERVRSLSSSDMLQRRYSSRSLIHSQVEIHANPIAEKAE